jgi:Uma2 family endonuclease
MVQPITAAKPHKLTFEEYRFYEGESGVRYELFRGHLIAMATPSGLHTNICAFLVHHLQRHFVAQNLDWVAKTDAGVRTDGASTRIPDVVICSQLLWDQVCARAGAGILDFEETPQLVVEVTSTNWREDYIRKRAEYALLDIPEYWIVDTDK